jgi:hypothetical protein
MANLWQVEFISGCLLRATETSVVVFEDRNWEAAGTEIVKVQKCLKPSTNTRES